MRHYLIVTLVLFAASTPQGVLAQEPYDDLEAEAEGIVEEEVEEESPEEFMETTEAPPTKPVEVTEQSASGLTLGLRLGGGYNSMFAPVDPAGATTLLRGSKFTGPSVQLGGQAGLRLSQPTPAISVGIDAGLAYSWMRGRGFAENADRTKRQTITLTTHALRLPVLLMVRASPQGKKVGFRAGAGPEVLLGFASGATVRFEQIDASAPQLFTTPVQHVGVMGLLGVDIAAKGFVIPIEVRTTWDPQVGTSTTERFEDYVSPEQPGSYQVAFNLHLHLTTGVEWSF